ncbi:MAG: DNA polymerase III subunit alpha, partial [Erysipelotrichaceae bacterium]|nr:DNA polymerase III subunit alpha [Erysipelotrichaceae bacterium]
MSVHLHARTSFSLLSSTLSIASLVNRNKELGFTSVTLCDYKVLHGVPLFLKECKKAGMKPIIGMEFPISYFDQIVPCVLLAKNVKGYKELVKLSSLLNIDHESISIEELIQYSKDCVLIMYGEDGILESSLVNEDRVGLSILLNKMVEQLPEFYLALSYNETSFWKMKNNLLKECAKALGIKTVALNKIYYEQQEDSRLYKAVNAIRLGKLLEDKSLIEVKGRFIRSKDQLYQIYDKEDLEATETINSLIEVYDLPSTSLPHYQAPEGVKSDYYLQQLALAGLRKRFSEERIPDNYIQRLKYELNVILQLHFEDYFLIVYDYIRYARKEGIYVGPGRGSAAGSLVAYCLGITHIDPIKYNLLFERFLNPERVSMPDIDTDFPDDKRDQVIHYVNEKYGSDHVARIVTFGTLGAKQVLRDVGRIMNMPVKDVDLLCKLIPNAPKMTLAKAIEQPKLREIIEANVRYQQLYELAKGIEGLPRHTSLHAAGVVFAKDVLDEVVPLMAYEGNEVCTQYTMEYLEELGLIKMDFLGLKNYID